MLRSRLTFAVLAVLAVLAAACGSDDALDSGGSGNDPVRIGWVGPLTEGAVSEGEEMLAAAEIAVEQVNAGGGVLGRNLELFVRDTRADPDAGVAAMQELIDDEGVVAVIGEVHSSVAAAQIEVAHERGVPFVVADAWADEITEARHPEVFRIAPANSLIYENVSAWVAEAGFEQVSIVVESSAYGANATELIGAALDESEVAHSVIVVDADAIDADAIVDDLIDDAPDLIMVLIASDTAYGLIGGICDAGLAPSAGTALYVGAGPGVASALWDEVGDCGRYVIAENLVLPEAEWNDLAAGLAEEMASDGMSVAIGGFAGFDALWIVADAVERAGTTDSAAIVEALASSTFTGARGTYAFSSETDPPWRFQQFLDAPLTVIQYLEADQRPTDAEVLTPPRWATVDTYATPG